MANPTAATTIQRPELAELAWEHLLDASQRGFIGMQVMPIRQVPERAADYPVIPTEAVLKVPDNLRRGARGAYSRGDWEFETNQYACDEYGWEEPVDDLEAALYDRFFDAEAVSTEIAMDIILRAHEKRVAAFVLNVSNAVGTAAIVNEWDDAANATPKADIVTARQSMRNLGGVTPNAIIMSRTVMENVLITQELRDYLQYTTPHLVEGLEAQRATLARYFGVEQVLAGDALEDTSAKGQTSTIADIWSNEFVSLCRISAGGDQIREPVFGRTFLWQNDSPVPVVVETYREEATRSTIVRARQNVDEAIIYVGANYVLSNATT